MSAGYRPWSAAATLAVAAGVLAVGTGSAADGGAAAEYGVDPTHSFVAFEIAGALSTLRGRFERQQGRLLFDRVAGTGGGELVVQTAALSTGVPGFDDWLRGPEVLDVARYPVARFAVTRLRLAGREVRAVEGELSLRDLVRPLALRAERFDCYTSPLLRREVCGGDFVAAFDRRDWALGPADERRLPYRLRLLVQIEAIRQ